MSGTGRHQTSGILGIENSEPHVIYDLSLPLPERREKALVFRSINYVARFLGVSKGMVVDYRFPGKRIKDRNGKEWAVRLCPPDLLHKLK